MDDPAVDDSAEDDPAETTGPGPRALAPGSKVEVRRRYDRRWARGFEVAGRDGERYLLRRQSDGTVLPTSFDRTDLRRERDGTWWF